MSVFADKMCIRYRVFKRQMREALEGLGLELGVRALLVAGWIAGLFMREKNGKAQTSTKA